MAVYRSSRPLGKLDIALAEFNNKLTQDEQSRFRVVHRGLGADIHVAYFFYRFNEEQSLQAKTIIRCLIREFLSPDSLKEDTEAALGALQADALADPKDLTHILCLATRGSAINYIVLDGVEERTEGELQDVLLFLEVALQNSTSSVKVILSARSKVGRFAPFWCRLYNVSIEESITEADIETYVMTELQGRQTKGQLVIGDPTLVLQIRDALRVGAQGMYVFHFALPPAC